MFVHEEELASAAGALPLGILFSSVLLLPSLIKQTSMKQIHTVLSYLAVISHHQISCSQISLYKNVKNVYHKLS